MRNSTMPRSLTINAAGEILMADSDNQHIHKFAT